MKQIYRERLVAGSRNQYCDAMYDRLKDIFTPSECQLAREILKATCRASEGLCRDDFEKIHARLVPEPSHRALAAEDLDYVLDTLKHDGYLLQSTRGQQFTRFASNILRDFWLESLRQWEYATQNAAGKPAQLLDEAPADIEARAQRDFLQQIERSGKRALLLIDNLNTLLGSINDPEPLHRLRAFLMKSSQIMIIGTANRYFDQITSVDQPFYEFFHCFDLHPLSLEEMQECLVALADTRGDESIKKSLEKRRGTIQALHILTGGNPRLIKTFYRLLKDGLQGNIRTDLEKLLDEFTPYFKSMVDALSVQQQRIFDAVALAWDPVEVSVIARATRLPSNQISAQLRMLVKNGLVNEALGHPKRKTYLLADRFSNIHYLMRHGHAARNRFDWFVAMVRLVFPDKGATDILGQVAQVAAECGPEGQRGAEALLHSYAPTPSQLADLPGQRDGITAESQEYAARGLASSPDLILTRSVFLQQCGDHVVSWRTVLPKVAAWCITHPKAEDVFNFTVNGFLRLARLAQPSEALALIETLPDATPFETVRDAFKAHADRSHLNRLAPERQSIAIELLKRINDSGSAVKPSTRGEKTRL